MTEKELANTLRAAYDEEMPDLLDGIMQACQTTVQADGTVPVSVRKRPGWIPGVAALAACFVLFFVGLAVGRFLPGEGNTQPLPPPSEPETVLYMDVNPSVEMQLDAQGLVIDCLPGNADAEAVLSDLELAGVERNTALAAVLGSMYLNGYLKEDSNSILISVDDVGESEDEVQTEQTLQQITDEINAVFADLPMECAIIAQHVEVSEELKQHAEELGVSVGKLHLVEKMAQGYEMLKNADIESLSELSIGELNLMYTTCLQSEEGQAFADDVVSGVVSGFMEMEEAVAAQIERFDIAEFLLEEYTSGTEYREIEGQWRLVYRVSMKFKYGDVAYSFSIDCESGELVESDFEPGALADIRLPDWGT